MKKNPVTLRVPPGSEVRNYLYRDMPLFQLNQDLLLVELKNGVCIDVGWFPENDPKGCFVIHVFYGMDDYAATECETVDDVIQTVERLSNHFDKETVPTSRSSDKQVKYAIA